MSCFAIALEHIMNVLFFVRKPYASFVLIASSPTTRTLWRKHSTNVIGYSVLCSLVLIIFHDKEFPPEIEGSILQTVCEDAP
jgi:hypothetical protein